MAEHSTQTALVVSPWPTDREFIVWLLAQRRFVCREVGTVKAAILALDRERFDLIVLDHHLVEAEEDFRQVRDSAPTTPLVLIAESTALAHVKSIDDQTIYLQRGQLTYHLLEKVPGYQLDDRVLRVIEDQLIRWSRPIFGADPTTDDLKVLSEIVATWLRRRRLLRTWTGELLAKVKPTLTLLLISAGAYILQQWVGIIDWRAILKGIGFDVGP